MNTWWMNGKTFSRTIKKERYRVRWLPMVITESCERVDVPHLCAVEVGILRNDESYIFRQLYRCNEIGAAITLFGQLESEHYFCRSEISRMSLEKDAATMEELL